MNALKALEAADTLIHSQSSTILKVSNELVKQCEESRARHSSKVIPSVKPSVSYAETVTSNPTLILKRNEGSYTIDRANIDAKLNESLKDIHVNKTRIVGTSDTVVIEFPNDKSRIEGEKNLKREFSHFSIEN